MRPPPPPRRRMDGSIGWLQRSSQRTSLLHLLPPPLFPFSLANRLVRCQGDFQVSSVVGLFLQRGKIMHNLYPPRPFSLAAVLWQQHFGSQRISWPPSLAPLPPPAKWPILHLHLAFGTETLPPLLHPFCSHLACVILSYSCSSYSRHCHRQPHLMKMELREIGTNQIDPPPPPFPPSPPPPPAAATPPPLLYTDQQDQSGGVGDHIQLPFHSPLLPTPLLGFHLPLE